MELLGDFLREPRVQQLIVRTKCDGTRADDRDNGLLLHASEKLIPKGIVEFRNHAQFCYLRRKLPWTCGTRPSSCGRDLRFWRALPQGKQCCSCETTSVALDCATGFGILQNGLLVSSVTGYTNGAANERPREESLHNGRF